MSIILLGIGCVLPLYGGRVSWLLVGQTKGAGMVKKLILCDCRGTFQPDVAAIAGVDGVVPSAVHSDLCCSEQSALAAHLQDGGCAVACAQEWAVFEDLAAELGVPAPATLDLRDRAGWSGDTGDAGPKVAALVADALLPSPPIKTFDVETAGLCLILGPTDVALRAAEKLCDHLSVTVLINPGQTPPMDRRFQTITGCLRHAGGSLGQFSVVIDALQQVEPAGRGDFTLTAPRDGAKTECDVILDLRGDVSLFPAHEKRDGYLRADPKRPEAVFDAIMTASHLIGVFEKPLYVASDPLLCAHERAGQTGCSNCLDACPTGAISPDGDHVRVDPSICAGCGACAALCPSGAITYDAPAGAHVFARMQTMAQAYRRAGGTAPRLLVHSDTRGRDMIALAARYDRGLPHDVVPMDSPALAGFGHAEMVAALAVGFAGVDILIDPQSDRATIERELALAAALCDDAARLRLLDVADPEALCHALYDADLPAPVSTPILPLGSRRQIVRLAARALHPGADTPLPLPETAPYGAVLVDTDACTLCLSCASLCPAGALGDNPDAPQLSFTEDACLQCGICATACPENAIALQPQMDLRDRALSPVILHEEDPYPCIECGKLFGVKSTVERIVAKLQGQHPMFADSAAGRMIRMCEDCRVNAQFHMQNNPMAAGDRPRVRTTEDYLSKRRDH